MHVPAGQALFLQGDAGDAMYLLTDGRLEVRVSRDAAIDTLTPPAPLGETALLTGRPRSATVAATVDATLRRLPAAAFTTLVRQHPVLLERLEEAMRPRLRRTHLAPLLHDWFDVRDATDVARLEAELDWIELASGETLFAQGDPGDAVYLVVSGRLRLERAAAERAEAPRIVGEVAPGESTGETSMLLGSARAATARALRDTRLVRVPPHVAERHAPFMTRLARVVAKRGQRRGDGRGRGRPPRTFALLGLTVDAPLATVAAGVAAGLADHGGAEIVDRHAIERAFDLPDVADASRGEATALVLGDWLDRQERTHAHLLYVTDDRWTPWSERCVRQADRVVLVANTESSAAADQVVEHVRALAPDTPIELMLVRPEGCLTPSKTATWLDRVRPRAHHHVRLGDAGELRRAARRITGQGRILVLSGGGARGYVHIGLLTAIEAAGLEIDAVAGTSMGALVGGAYAMSRSAAFAEASARRFGDPKRIVDRTLAVPSILSTLTKATSLNSHYLMERIGQGADLLVRYPTDGVGSLEFDRVDELIQVGRTHADAALAGWTPDPVPAG